MKAIFSIQKGLTGSCACADIAHVSATNSLLTVLAFVIESFDTGTFAVEVPLIRRRWRCD